MERRSVLAVVGTAIAAWRLAAAAPVVKSHLVAVLGNEDRHYWDGLRHGLRDLGYDEGRNLRYAWRWSHSVTERLPALAAELVALRPDVLVVSGSQAARAAQAATATIPIVMAIVGNPVETGVVASLTRPGGNITGSSFFWAELNAKRLELLNQLVPTGETIAVLANPAISWTEARARDVQSAAHTMRRKINVVNASSERDIDEAFAGLAALRARARATVMAVVPCGMLSQPDWHTLACDRARTLEGMRQEMKRRR